MKPILLRLVPVLLLSGGALRAAEPGPTTGDDPGAFPREAFVAVGSSFAQSTRLADLGMSDEQFDAFIEGLRATFQGRPRPLDPQAQRLHAAIGRRLQRLAEQQTVPPPDFFADPRRVEDYVKEAAKKFRLQRSDSGLAYGLMPNGTARPGPDDTVVVTYEVVAADMQTELPRLGAKARRVRVSDLPPGLAEGVQMLAADGTAMLVVPPDLAFADGAWPADVPRAPLIFTVKLHEIIAAP